MKKTVAFVLGIIAVIALAMTLERTWLSSKGTVTSPANSDLPMAPEVSVKNLGGKDVTLAQFRGKVVLLNFWATYCGPCRIEMPWFIEFQEKYAEKGFTVLGMAMDDEGEEVVEPWIRAERFEVEGKQRELNYPILIGNPDIGQRFGIFGLPTTLVISRDGYITKRFIGLVNHELILKEIEKQLPQPAP